MTFEDVSVNVSLIDSGCFGTPIPPAIVWLLAAHIGAINLAFGQYQPRSLRWSVPYAIAAAVCAFVAYLPDAAVMLSPYNRSSRLLLDPVFWPAHGLLAGTFIAPVVGLSIRGVFGRR